MNTPKDRRDRCLRMCLKWGRHRGEFACMGCRFIAYSFDGRAILFSGSIAKSVDWAVFSRWVRRHRLQML